MWVWVRGQREFSIPGILDESQLHFFSLDHKKWFSEVSISSRNMRVAISNLVLVSKYENGQWAVPLQIGLPPTNRIQSNNQICYRMGLTSSQLSKAFYWNIWPWEDRQMTSNEFNQIKWSPIVSEALWMFFSWCSQYNLWCSQVHSGCFSGRGSVAVH